METIEDLKRRIRSTEELQSVVKTMKAMAAVKIRQYELAVESLRDYSETVVLGLRAALKGQGVAVGAREAAPGPVGAVIFGSDQGMCGQLNDQVVSHALESLQDISGARRDDSVILAVGKRATGKIQDSGQVVEETLNMPGSVNGVFFKVQELLSRIETWNRERGVNRVVLTYSRPLSGARYRPHTERLLPVDRQWLAKIREEKWPTRALPLTTAAWNPLFSGLIREYLFISLFRGFVDSLASENAARLASMQGAEKNIQEQLSTLTMRFHQQRQMSITEELLDVIAGFEVLKEE